MARGEERTGKRGEAGGKVSANRSVTPAAVMKLLEGIHFPADKDKIEELAEQNKSRVENSGEILDLIHRLPSQVYQGVPDITQAIGTMI